MPKDCNSKTKEEVEALLIEKANSEKVRVETILAPANIVDHVQDIHQKLDESLKQDTDDWKNLIPGKPLLSKLCSQAKIPVSRLKKLYINEAKTTTPNPFDDIVSIFADFNSF
jgi:succinylglutamate desuccinylase